MTQEITDYHNKLSPADLEICTFLHGIISRELPEAENKIWHSHPVWFIEGNPIVGYDKLKNHVRLLFWSGDTFDEVDLKSTGKFRAAEARFTDINQIDEVRLIVWLEKSKTIQWDYKNIVKRKGKLERLS